MAQSSRRLRHIRKIVNFTLSELAAAVGGTLTESWPEIVLSQDYQPLSARALTFSIDTRTLQAGDVFIALPGEQADGHTYLAQALHKGARGLIISQPESLTALPPPVSARLFVIVVTNTLVALHDIARACRQKNSLTVGAVTGSNGKTTVKDMAAAILRVHYGAEVLQSEKSFNNHIGLPLTLANMTPQHHLAILEMGMNAPGEIRLLAGIAAPTVGLVTNIAQAHAGFFDSLEAIMRAKMELLEALPADGIAILNHDDPLYPNMRLHAKGKVVTFGLRITRQRAEASSKHAPEVSAVNIAVNPDATYAFDLTIPGGSVHVTLPLPGYHNIHNALAATALALAVSAAAHTPVSLTDIQTGLEQFTPSPMRMHVTVRRQVTLINDAYNANPASMESALKAMYAMHCRGKKLAVLGDMLELGALSASAHYRVGELAAEAGVQGLFLLGAYAAQIAQGALEAGLTETQIVFGTSHRQLAEALLPWLAEGDIVLFKGSRGMTMEKVLDQLEALLTT